MTIKNRQPLRTKAVCFSSLFLLSLSLSGLFLFVLAAPRDILFLIPAQRIIKILRLKIGP